MTTTAGNAAVGGEKEKVEKRRALGRGLESLLPGPRVVAAVPRPAVAHPTAPHPTVPGQGVASGEPITIQAVVEDASQSPPFAKDAKDGAASVSSLPAGTELRSGGRAGSGGPVQDSSTQTPAQMASTQMSPAQISSVPGFSGQTPITGDDGSSRAGAPAPHIQGQDSGIRDASEETITILAQAESRMPGNLVVNLNIRDIDKNPFQTRYVDDDEKLEELSDSIKANGVVQPITVRPGDEEGRYILVLGERRLLASKKAGKTTIPALVRRVSLQQAAEMTIIENLQREDLSALEQAEAFRVLSREFSLTQAQIGERVGLSRESVSNYMRLLKLPLLVMEQLAHKQIGFSEARELLKLDDPELIQKTADYIVAKHMTLDQVETLIMRMTGLLDPVPGMPGQVVERKKSGARWVDPNVKAAQTDLERMLGVKVRIRDRKGKGKIVIEYHTVDDYERVVEMLRGKK